METKNVKAFGTEAAEAPLKTLDIKRRAVQAHDVEIEILYCGICHSDLQHRYGGIITKGYSALRAELSLSDLS